MAYSYTSEAAFEKDVINLLKDRGWTDGVLEYPSEEDLLDNWKSILFKNNDGVDRLNGCRLTDGEMGQILEQIAELRSPYLLNGWINGRSVAIKRDNEDDKLHFGGTVSLKIYDRKEIAGGESTYQIAQQPQCKARDKWRCDMPLVARFKFAITGKLSATYVKKSSSLTTVTATDVGQFDEIKGGLEHFENESLKEIPNSLTSFRMAAGYLNAIREGVDGLKTKELVDVLDSSEGYGLYDIGEGKYVRFNSKAFVSNYKYNDILLSKLDLYCIPIGLFDPSEFDYMAAQNRAQTQTGLLMAPLFSLALFRSVPFCVRCKLPLAP